MSYADGSKNAERREAPRSAHSLSLENRARLTISGVEEVESFDEHEIVMRCAGALLVVSGAELSVSRLVVESGDVTVTGRVDSLAYEEPPAARFGFWSRAKRG